MYENYDITKAGQPQSPHVSPGAYDITNAGRPSFSSTTLGPSRAGYGSPAGLTSLFGSSRYSDSRSSGFFDSASGTSSSSGGQGIYWGHSGTFHTPSSHNDEVTVGDIVSFIPRVFFFVGLVIGTPVGFVGGFYDRLANGNDAITSAGVTTTFLARQTIGLSSFLMLHTSNPHTFWRGTLEISTPLFVIPFALSAGVSAIAGNAAAWTVKTIVTTAGNAPTWAVKTTAMGLADLADYVWTYATETHHDPAANTGSTSYASADTKKTTAPAAIATSFPAAAKELVQYAKINTIKLNVRNGPGHGYRIIGGLPKGREFKVVGNQDADWVQIAEPSLNCPRGCFINKYYTTLVVR